MPCKCRSYAINDDPLQQQCDRCWRDGIIRARDEEIDLLKNKIDILKAKCDRDDSLRQGAEV